MYLCDFPSVFQDGKLLTFPSVDLYTCHVHSLFTEIQILHKFLHWSFHFAYGGRMGSLLGSNLECIRFTMKLITC